MYEKKSYTPLQFLYSITTSKDIVEILIPFVLIIGHLCFMFFGNHIGQVITDNNAEIFNTVWVTFFWNFHKLFCLLYICVYIIYYVCVSYSINYYYHFERISQQWNKFLIFSYTKYGNFYHIPILYIYIDIT